MERLASEKPPLILNYQGDQSEGLSMTVNMRVLNVWYRLGIIPLVRVLSCANASYHQQLGFQQNY